MDLHQALTDRRSALLVIDVQNDYIHDRGSLARRGHDVKQIQAMVPRLQEAIESARRHGVPIYFIRNAHGPNTNSETLLSRPSWRDGAGGPGQAGTWGAEWYDVEPSPEDVVMDKYRYDAFLGTPLELMLRASRIETVVCCGTATNVCVDSTARAAFMRDFYVVVLEDCCAASDIGLHEAALETIRRNFGWTAPISQVTQAWESRADTAVTTTLVSSPA